MHIKFALKLALKGGTFILNLCEMSIHEGLCINNSIDRHCKGNVGIYAKMARWHTNNTTFVLQKKLFFNSFALENKMVVRHSCFIHIHNLVIVKISCDLRGCERANWAIQAF